MLQDLLNHEAKLSQLLHNTKSTSHNWQQELHLHELYLYHLQRERLLHLIVTVTTALFTIIIISILLFLPSLLLGILTILLICLLVPYIFHYRKIENTVQHWYLLSSELESKINDM